MRIILFVTAWIAIHTTVSMATEPLSLSAEQQVKVGDIITSKNSEAMPAPNWPVAIDGLVPENVNLKPLPTTAENVASLRAWTTSSSRRRLRW